MATSSGIKKIHQLSAGFNPGDAISNEMIAIRNFFQTKGIEGRIYSENIGSKDRGLSRNISSFSENKNDLIIYHHSIHSGITEILKELLNPKVMIYHNVTPHEFFESYDLKLTYYLRKGREELAEIKTQFLCSFADSEFNLNELRELDYKNTYCLPIIYDYPKLIPFLEEHRKPDSDLFRILFVGRIAPNKKQEDLIRFAEIYRRMYGDEFLLSIVGYCSLELRSYEEELRKMIKYYNLEKNVELTDFVSDSDLYSIYRSADLFLSMSEHEGFCVPLIEAMFFNIPVLAFAGGAVRGTLGDAGILLEKKDFPMAAFLAEKIRRDKSFREKTLYTQNDRLTYFTGHPGSSFLEEKIRFHLGC